MYIIKKTKVIRNFAIALGIIGSLIGFFYYIEFHNNFSFKTTGEIDNEIKQIYFQIRNLNDDLTEIVYLLFFFIPACIGLVGSVFKKSYLLYIAFLLSLPVGEYVGFNANSHISVHFPLYLYIASAFLFSLINYLYNSKNN